MKKMMMTAAAMFCVLGSSASTVEPDTMKVEQINEIIIMGVKMKKDAPFAIHSSSDVAPQPASRA